MKHATAKKLNTGQSAWEFHFDDHCFATIADIAMSEVGIKFHESKSALIYSRLVKRLRHLRMESFQEYCKLVSSQEGQEERGKMLNALTTNVTRFFRESHHFEHFKTTVLPSAIAHAKSGGRVRFWSAGCSSGQEPYSMALSLLALLPDARAYDIKILATDVSSDVLRVGQAARYPMSEYEEIPSSLRKMWTETDGDHFIFDDAVRNLVSFKYLNLIKDWPMRGEFDAIFCRNVMIYFQSDTQAQLWSKFIKFSVPYATFYIGHSERIPEQLQSQFRVDGITTYCRK